MDFVGLLVSVADCVLVAAGVGELVFESTYETLFEMLRDPD